jgi:dienelactone hydrolase
MHTFESHTTGAVIRAGQITLHGQLHIPPEARGLVIFAHGCGSGRNWPRNQRVAEVLHDVGLATLLFDLLSPDEAPADAFHAQLGTDVTLLAERLRAAMRWAGEQPEISDLPIGLFGASTGAAAAIIAAEREGPNVSAVVTRGGHPEVAYDAARRLRVPTLLVVGGNDDTAVAGNLEVWAQLRCEKAIEIIPGAGHFFEERGALENVAALAARWFSEHLRKVGVFAA